MRKEENVRGKCTGHAVTTGRGMCMSRGQLSILPPGLNSLACRSCCVVHVRGKCTGHAVTTGRGMCMSHSQLSILPPGLNSLACRSCCVVHLRGMARRNLLLCRTYLFFNKNFLGEGCGGGLR